jgi:hypothetical protein
VTITSFTRERGGADDVHRIRGAVIANCEETVDVTVSVRWVDGADRGDAWRAFVTLTRVLPREPRDFNEVVVGGRGATRVDLVGSATRAGVMRRFR